MMAFCPQHPKWGQNPKFTPLSTTTSIPTLFICGVLPRALDTGKCPLSLFKQVNLENIWGSRRHKGRCLLQGHPTTVFCKISVRRSKICPGFSMSLGRLKIFWWPFHSRTIFEAYLINFLRFSEVQCFTFHSLGKLIFRRRKPKISDSKMQW